VPIADHGPIAHALRAFELAHGARICFHDLSGRLREHLPEGHNAHLHQPCATAKSCSLPECMAFDVDHCRTLLQRRREGFWKLCHAGVLEMMLPVLTGGELIAVCFVGMFRWAGNGEPPAHVERSRAAATPRLRGVAALPPLHSDEQLAHLMQLALMLVARLQELVPAHDGRRPFDRREEITHYLERHYRHPITLGGLARQLDLSESRTGQVVRELFACTWPELLADFRLRHACNLLEQTEMSVTEISEHCGFSDPAYFHRVFRKRHGCTPLDWRERARV